jgi:hypothetical protein
MKNQKQQTTMQALLKYALTLPETEEGIACEGTAVESHTVKTKKKAFLFIRASDARLKLATSLPEATALAAKEPERYSVGAHGWVLIKLDGSAAYPLDVLKRWVKESHALFGGSDGVAAKSRTASRQDKKKSSKRQ